MKNGSCEDIFPGGGGNRPSPPPRISNRDSFQQNLKLNIKNYNLLIDAKVSKKKKYIYIFYFFFLFCFSSTHLNHTSIMIVRYIYGSIFGGSAMRQEIRSEMDDTWGVLDLGETTVVIITPEGAGWREL